MMETASKSSSWASEPARTAAALSRTEGTDCSSCSVSLPRGMRCGSALVGEREVAGVMGSMSRSKMAEEDECLRKVRCINAAE